MLFHWYYKTNEASSTQQHLGAKPGDFKWVQKQAKEINNRETVNANILKSHRGHRQGALEQDCTSLLF